MAYVLRREIDLSQFGWKDCKFVVNALTYSEMQNWTNKITGKDTNDPELAKEVVDLVKTKFIEGQALNEKDEKVPIDASKFEELPFDIILHVTSVLSGGAAQDTNLPQS